MTYLAGFPFFDCRVTLLAAPTFRDKNSLAHPAGSTQSKRDNQCVHEHFFKLLAWVKVTLFSHINTHKGWFSWEGDPLYRGNFSQYKQCLRANQASDNFALAVKPFNFVSPKCDQLQFFLNNVNTSSIEVDLNLTKDIKLPILVRDVKYIRQLFWGSSCTRTANYSTVIKKSHSVYWLCTANTG